MALSIETAQNVIIEQPIASVGNRIGAHVLDLIFKIAYAALITITLTLLGKHISGSPFIVLLFSPLFFYSILCEMIFNGQSPGKMIAKLQVVRTDGKQLTFGSLLLRWVCRLVDIQMFGGAVGTSIIAFGGKGQRLGDIAAGTTVVLLKPANTISDTIFRTLPANYQIQFPQVDQLSEKDLQISQNVLNALKRNPLYNSPKIISLAFKAKNALEKKMGIKTEIPPKIFIETIILDYNYYYQNLD